MNLLSCNYGGIQGIFLLFKNVFNSHMIPNRESLSSKTSKIEKYENMKTVKLDRTHQEDLSEISQLLTETSLIIYSQPTPHISYGSPCSLIPCYNQLVGPQNKSNKRSPHELHKYRKHEHQDEN